MFKLVQKIGCLQHNYWFDYEKKKCKLFHFN